MENTAPNGLRLRSTPAQRPDEGVGTCWREGQDNA